MDYFIQMFVLFREMLLRVGQQDEDRNEPVLITCSTLVVTCLSVGKDVWWCTTRCGGKGYSRLVSHVSQPSTAWNLELMLRFAVFSLSARSWGWVWEAFCPTPFSSCISPKYFFLNFTSAARRNFGMCIPFNCSLIPNWWEYTFEITKNVLLWSWL